MKRPTKTDPNRSSLHCVVDSFDEGVILGWAYDPQFGSDPARFYVLVDGEHCGEALCDGSRLDVAAAGLAGEQVGYRIVLPQRLMDGQQHHVEFRDMRRLPVIMRVNDNPADSFNFTCTWRPRVRSYVDGLRNGGLEGWVLQSNYETGLLEGNCMVRVTCDGATIGHTRANRSRADVGKSLSATANCGFRFVPPRSVLRGAKQVYRFYLMPGDHELDQSPVTASLIADETERRMLDLCDAVDRIHVELTKLRRQIRELVPKPVFTVENYDEWYPAYARALTQRIVAARAPAQDTPLVSVVCPVYRPILDEFRAAVQSVIAQTYTNWELILVDDASNDLALTACIAGFARADARIKVRAMEKNGGISNATNMAIAAAEGAWVAFFDHDDLLADVALETMLRAAQKTGGRLLYSDEDKVDSAGHFMAPAFKPDWNHRLMLGVNYVCHLLFVDRAALDLAGPLNGKLDGAQDHDLILRLSETLSPPEIVHVPEILYHWRITANSTASDVGAKPYAIAAGIACVRDHLNRLGRPAVVTNIKATTLYHQKWKFPREPEVEIIIPFKDEIATTRRCIDTIISTTRYRNYRVVLIDNWSTSVDSQAFRIDMAKLRNVRVMRVEEPFNYSRLNNLAAHASTAEFLVLLNNDVFVADGSWLRVCVDEALADPAVAVVGGKFLYPSRAVQHAGIIMGIGGVGGHIGIGLPEDDYGYGGRLLFAQEYSGVTAAGMLVRRAAFEAVGGLDEKDLTVAFNDVDFCMKIRAAGYKIIWTPDFLAEHHESLSRGDDERPAQEARFFHESQVMKERWGDRLLSDPFYNKNLGLDRAPFTELLPPETAGARDWTTLVPPFVPPPLTARTPEPAAIKPAAPDKPPKPVAAPERARPRRSKLAPSPPAE